jgi:hypothetical protein
MAEVTGFIGNENVELNNAATEATLKALLLAVSGSEQKMRQLMDAAAKAGLDSKSIEAANDAVQKQTATLRELKQTEEEYAEGVRASAQLTINRFTALNNSILTLMTGTMSASGAFSLMTSELKGPWALLAAGASKLIAIQEENFATYQKLSSSGINFAGNLTQMRMAAAESYLTLDQFSKVMKENSESFAKMGGTANEGAIAFSKVNKELIQGEAGKQLMALGYSAEEVSGGLASYIAMTGGRNAQEMKDTKALSSAAGAYLTELDELAQITGKSREQQEAALKEASANQAYQSYLMTLDEEGKKKANLAMAEAMAKGGKGAADALQSQLLGLPPMTKAAQEFTAIAPRMAAANNKMADAVKDGSKGIADIKRAGNELGVAANQTKRDLGKTGEALIMGGGSFSSTMGAIFGTANRNAQQGVETLEDADNQRKTLEQNRKEREQSQADDMAKVWAGFKELGAELWDVFSPLLSAVTLVARGIGYLASGIASVIKGFNGFFNMFGEFGTVMKGVTVAILAYIVAKKMSTAMELVKGKTSDIVGGLAGKLTGGAGAAAGVTGGVGKIAGGAAGVAGGSIAEKVTGGVGKMGGGAADMAKGAGQGFMGFIKSIGRGFASLAPIAVPMLIGAGAVAGVIALLGAGVAAAIALIGLSLPTFAKGLTDIANIDGINLLKVAAGIGALGVAMVAFTGGSIIGGLGAIGSKVLNFFSGGGPIGMIKDSITELTPILPQLTAIGPAINTYAQGIIAFGRAVNTVDIAKAKELKEVLKGPSAADQIASAGAQMIKAATAAVTGQGGKEEKTHSELAALNTTMKELIRYMKDTADNTKKTHEATRSLNGNMFAA